MPTGRNGWMDSVWMTPFAFLFRSRRKTPAEVLLLFRDALSRMNVDTALPTTGAWGDHRMRQRAMGDCTKQLAALHAFVAAPPVSAASANALASSSSSRRGTIITAARKAPNVCPLLTTHHWRRDVATPVCTKPLIFVVVD